MDGAVPNIEELLRNLKHQTQLYKQLSDIVRDEREHIIAVNHKEIRESTYAKEAVIDEIQREEQRRLAWLDQLAVSLGRPPIELTIEAVAKMHPAQSEQLLTLKNALLLLVRKAKEANLDNKRLVEIALNDAQELKRNILGLVSDKPQVYGPNGQMGGKRPENNSRMVDKEA